MRSIWVCLLVLFTIRICYASEVMSPRIVELDGFHIVGMQTFGSPSDGSFPKMWSALLNFEGTVSNITNDAVSYGIETYTKEHHTHGKHYNVIITAIAREMVAYLWAIAKEVVLTPVNPALRIARVPA
jgi:hypothetical protein